MTRALCWLLLAGCTIPVNVGSLASGFGGGGGGGVSGVDCTEPGTRRAYRVTLAETAVDDPNCWDGGVVPADHLLPAQTFDIVVASTTVFYGTFSVSPAPLKTELTLGLDGLPAQQLGNAPEIIIGEGIGGEGTRFDWTRVRRSRATVMDDATETRSTFARFDFDRFDTAQTAGTLALSSSFSCTPGPPPRNAPCGAPRDTEKCEVIRTFVATPSTLAARWFVPTTPTLEGSTTYLVSLDLGAISRPDMRCVVTRPPTLLVEELTPNLRALEVWQANASTVRVPPRSYQLGEAPRLDLESDFSAPPNEVQVQELTGLPVVDARELTTTRAGLPGRICGFFPDGAYYRSPELLELESASDCTGSACPGGAIDRTFCQVAIEYFAIELATAPFTTSP